MAGGGRLPLDGAGVAASACASDCHAYLKFGHPSAERPPTVRQASAGTRPPIPSTHLGWQVEFITCTVGDTTHSGCHYLLVSLYKLDPRASPAPARPPSAHRGQATARSATLLKRCASGRGWIHAPC